jgi:curved DNA-binding protein CbpA
MARDRRDPKGYYAVLNLSPGASDAEVQLAYTFLKNAWRTNRKIDRARVKEAYDVLIDPKTRREYQNRRRGSVALDRTALYGAAVGLIVVLFAVAALLFPGFLLPAAQPFTIGDRLLNATDLAPLGEVIAVEPGHVFPNGGSGDAYRVRAHDGSEIWYPAADLEHHFRRSR